MLDEIPMRSLMCNKNEFSAHDLGFKSIKINWRIKAVNDSPFSAAKVQIKCCITGGVRLHCTTHDSHSFYKS